MAGLVGQAADCVHAIEQEEVGAVVLLKKVCLRVGESPFVAHVAMFRRDEADSFAPSAVRHLIWPRDFNTQCLQLYS